MIDKARAYSASTLGEYIFPCPLDKVVLEFLDTNHKEFANKSQRLNDDEMALWLNEKCLHKSEHEKKRINNKLLARKPDTLESLNRFNKILNNISPIVKNITTWIELIELEENQIPPQIL